MDPYKSEIVLMVFHRPSSTGLLFIVSLADCCGVHIGVVLAVCLADLCMQGSSFLVGLECRSALLIGSLSCRWLLFAWQLHLILSILLHRDEDAKSEATSNKEKKIISTITSIFQSIKHAEDMVDTSKSKNSHALCDLGLAITKRLVQKDVDLEGLSSSVSLPSMLYKVCEKKEGDDSLVKAIDEEMRTGFLGIGFEPKWGLKDIPIMPKEFLCLLSIVLALNLLNMYIHSFVESGLNSFVMMNIMNYVSWDICYIYISMYYVFCIRLAELTF